jgi:hypothetical protein
MLSPSSAVAATSSDLRNYLSILLFGAISPSFTKMVMSNQKMDAVVPLLLSDHERFEIMVSSLCKHFIDLNTCWVLVRDTEFEELNRRIRLPRFRVVRESEILPELSAYRQLPRRYSRRITGWYVQQLLKLAIAEHIQTNFYLTLDADVICMRPVSYHDLVPSDRAIVKTSRNDVHAEWYAWAERVLGCRRSGLTHGVTPAVFNREAVLKLQAFLAGRVSLPFRILQQILGDGPWADFTASWRSFLIRAIPWTEYALYHTFLESRGLALHYHDYRGDQVIYDSGASVWSQEDLRTWSIKPLVDGSYFIVLQSNTDVPVSLIRQKLGSLLVDP